MADLETRSFITEEHEAMANNGGRQGNAGAGGAAQMNEHVEFTVKVSFDRLFPPTTFDGIVHVL